ncbi:MAG: GxxExxY protein [Bacteroidia bacterium]|nr:GxxExxY protein [Bacteroidia bacterium]
MEIHITIGKGFSEAVYKDCLSIELDSEKIRFEREKKFEKIYKCLRIPHHYFADFIVDDSIVLEIKSQSDLIDENIKQILNYLAASKCKYGILINFGENSLKFKRIVLTK